MFLQTVSRTYGAKNPDFYLVFLGDFHIGNPAHDKKLLKRHLEQMPKNALIWFMGDMAEFIDWRDKRFEARSVDSYFWNELDRLHIAYVEYVAELLWPLRDQIVCLHDGNHERKLHPTYQPGYELARKLELLDHYAASAEAYTRVRFLHRAGGRVRSVMVNTHHGWQAGRMSGAKHNEMAKSLAWIGSDIVVRGHSHELFAEPSTVLVEPSKNMDHLIYRNRYVAHSGSYFQSRTGEGASYAERAQYPPMPLGHVRFLVSIGDTDTTGGTGRTIQPEVVM